MEPKSLKIAISQLNSIIGDFEYNIEQVEKAVSFAITQKADLIVFPELFICSFPPQDRLEQSFFLDEINKNLQLVQKLSENIGILIGTPLLNHSTYGKAIYNSACLFYKNELMHTTHKFINKNNDNVYEDHYYESGADISIVEFKNHKLVITIGELLANNFNFLDAKNGFSQNNDENNVDAIINITASSFDYLKHETKRHKLYNIAKQSSVPVIYVNSVGANTDLIFDGGSMIISAKGELVEQLKYFEEEIKIIDFSDIKNEHRVLKELTIHPITLIHKALVLGISDFFKKSNFKSALIGLSGGIDSSLVAALAVEALGCENVHTVFLPSSYTTPQSLKDAKLQALMLKTPFYEFNIDTNYRSILELLNLDNESDIDITKENIQSRLRGLLLMALSNKNSYILLNTSNKSEIATGYGTLYGDMCGALAVIGDLYKVQVYQLADYLNTIKPTIPQSIIGKAPSAELRPDQKDTDSLPDYSILDSILYHYIELNAAKEVILNLPEVNSEIVNKVLSLVDKAEFKRKQAAPILKISPKSFGRCWNFPLVEKKSS